jgi:hypothetical protein
MHDNNEGRVHIVRQALEKHLQSVNTARGRPDADRRKAFNGLGVGCSVAHLVHLTSQSFRLVREARYDRIDCKPLFERADVVRSPYCSRVTAAIVKALLETSSIFSTFWWLLEFTEDPISVLDLQCECRLKLLKQTLSLSRIVPVALEPDHKRNLRLDPLLTFHDMLAGKFKMLKDGGSVDSGIDSLQLTIQG